MNRFPSNLFKTVIRPKPKTNQLARYESMKRLFAKKNSRTKLIANSKHYCITRNASKFLINIRQNFY